MRSNALSAIVARCDFLQLTDSASRYPNHSGTGLQLLHINTAKCQATLALNGGQLMSFIPAGGEELLWVSPLCDFSEGASLRGGIPLCLPWFGPHPTDSSRPNHGIARTRQWSLLDAKLDEQRRAVVKLGLEHRADALFEHDFTAELTLTLGDTLSLELSLTNQSSRSFDASWMMHSYFAISDISQVRVEGLEGRQYDDKVADGVFTQSGPVTFAGQVDRIYQDVQLGVTLDDRGRRLQVAGDQCPSIVLWNTGPTLAAKVADIGPGNHCGYLCVERGACLGDSWQLAPGNTRHAIMTLTPS